MERQEIDPASPWWAVHVARYRFAVPYVECCRVLDVACGSGYGMAVLLEARARWVVGVDRNREAAQQAQNHLHHSSAPIIVADGCRLPFGNGSFDVVTSFETLEHLEQRKTFLVELRRVLITEGLCILSTPNANYTLPVGGKPRNPYHVHEYTPQELQAELSDHFARVTMLGQVLDSRFVIPPFRDEQQRISKDPRMRVLVALWRAMNKLPCAMRDFISQIIWNHPFLPNESDYFFSESEVDSAPVLVALCRGVLGR